MATKTATIVIDVQDKSLQELNNEIKALESSIAGLKTNTAEWQKQNQKLGQLKTQFNSATKEAQKLQNVIAGTEPTSISNGIRGVAKLGAGLVGTFAAVSGSIKLMGGSSEAFDEMQAKSLQLMQVMGGLNQVAEMFGTDSMGMLKKVGTGFKGLVTAVKGASLGIKTALISTGIGALIVGVGLLIANFDKIKKLFGDNKEKKSLEDKIKAYETINESQKSNVTALQEELNLEKQLAETSKKTSVVAEKNKELLQQQKMAIENEVILAKSKTKLAENAVTKLLEEKEVKKAISVVDGKMILELDQKNKKHVQFNEAVAALAIAKAKEVEVLAQEKAILDEINYADLYAKAAVEIDKVTEKIRINQDEITVLSSLQNESQAIYEEQLENIELQIVNIRKLKDDYGRLTKDQQDQVDALWAQWEALKNQNDERKKQLKIQLDALGYERSLQDAIADSEDLSKELNIQLTERINNLEILNEGYKYQVKLIQDEYKAYQDLGKIIEKKVNFDKKGAQYIEDMAENAKLLNDNFGYIRDSLVESLDLAEKDKGLFAGRINYAAQELGYAERLADATIAKIENEKSVLLLKKEGYQQTIKQAEWDQKIIQNQIDYYNKQLKIKQSELDHAKNAEERKVKLEEVTALEAKLDELSSQTLDNNQKIVDAKREIADADNEILSKEQEINKTTEDKVQKETEVTEQLRQQSEWHERANDFLDEYSQEIQVTQQLLAQTLEFMAALQDRKAQEAQDRIDKANEELDKLADAEDERNKQLEEWEELLKDANGDRYEELYSKIQKEKELKIAADTEAEANRKLIEEQIKIDENKKLAAEARAAKWRKAQALIDAIIQGALGVIKALPNVFLAVATGVLAAAGIATIAAQKTPDIPKGYSAGGFTPKASSDTDVAGVVHTNEYVAPAYVTRSAEGQAHIAALERQRLRGYAEGGLVQPSLGQPGQSMIDYDKMASAFYGAIIRMPNPQVSVVKITQAQNEVQLTKQNAGL